MTTKKNADENIENDPLSFDEKELFSDDNVPESAWFKFEEVGAKVSGVLVEFRDNVEARNPDFPNQRVFVLKTKDGSLVNVGIPMTKDYIIGRTNRVKLGDLIGFEFKKEIPSTKGKGFAPAKSIEVYVKSAPVPSVE